MGRDSTLGWTGGYIGLSLLAALITLGVMLILFTDDEGGSMSIDVGDVLSQPCNGGDTRFDACYVFIVSNVSEVIGRVECSVTDPMGGRAKFVKDERTYLSEPIPPDGSATVFLQVREFEGPTQPPTVACNPAGP
jgi:hypothetical protein